MKVLEKAIMPNGIEIQLEDWNDNNTKEYPNLYGLQIGTYPTAKNSSLFVKSGERFRLTISYNKYLNYNNENVKADFEALKSGKKSLEDLSKYFENGRKDMYYLGMINKV